MMASNSARIPAAARAALVFSLAEMTANLTAESVQLAHQRRGPLEDGHAVALHHLEHQVVLSIAQSFDATGVTGIVVGALGELDAARCEEVAHAVLSGFTVGVLLVVALDVERHERRGAARGLALDRTELGRRTGRVRPPTLERVDDDLREVFGL
jgi:hypothetical protein